MKQKIYILLALAFMAISCGDDATKVELSVETSNIEMEAVGGVHKVRVTANDRWIASTDNPWITISPANGIGEVTCEFKIDSALTVASRRGVVRIQDLETWEEKEIVIEQKGFPYSIEVSNVDVNIDNYDVLKNRYFDVKVKSNVDFTVDIPADAQEWLSVEDYAINLNRGVRPREVKVRFKWDINSLSEEREVAVKFQPKSNVVLSRADIMSVRQQAADPIIPDTRAGDSIALLCIERALNTLSSYDTSVPMTQWNNVVLWDETMADYTPEKEGRVKSVQFTMFNTSEKLPFEVRYLTAADELYFFGNSNTFLRNLELGDDISNLTQLRRLTVGSYGLISLPESLAKLKNLEYLDLGSNNFQTVPDVLTKENFPNLRTLVLNANQRNVIYDLSNNTRTNVGGFIDEPKFPVDLIKWDLDTLVLSVNYLSGELPDFKDDASVPFYTEQDLIEADTLPRFLVDNRIKKVMPSTKRFAINFNRLSGKLPDWLLYHPALDWWVPYSLVFPQEGRAADGTEAVFDNEPLNLNYYYEVYPNKKQADEYNNQQ